ncbi:hypothetical protein K0M31_002084, partial [Melipona bicolor]
MQDTSNQVLRNILTTYPLEIVSAAMCTGSLAGISKGKHLTLACNYGMQLPQGCTSAL